MKSQRQRRVIIFYDESVVFGGHEQMALSASQKVALYEPAIEVQWVINRDNLRLAAALSDAGITQYALDLNPESSFGHLRNPLSIVMKILRAARLVKQIRPSLLVLLQGTIIGSFEGVFAAHMAGVPVCSYIPITHRFTELGPHQWARLKDFVATCLYRLIPGFISIDDIQAMRIRQRNKHAQVMVVENYIPAPDHYWRRNVKTQGRYGFPPHWKIVGVVGRIQFSQKAQNWLVTNLANSPFLEDKGLLFVGDGPDRPELERLIHSSPWRDHMSVLGWRQNMDEVYNEVDALLIPSRMEGVPIVMLEALARRIPVVGSDRDGMKEWLPDQWRFPVFNFREMVNTVEFALENTNSKDWEAIDRHLCRITDSKRFAREFLAAFEQFSATHCDPTEAPSSPATGHTS